MSVQVDELRDVMATNYDELRSVFAHLREGDLARHTATGKPVWRLVAEIIVAPGRDARTAGRLAEGKSERPMPIQRAVDAVAGWRTGRALRNAPRAEVLAAWENAFNELFSFVNDVAAEPVDDDSKPMLEVGAVYAYLRQRLDWWPPWAEELRKATSPVATL